MTKKTGRVRRIVKRFTGDHQPQVTKQSFRRQLVVFGLALFVMMGPVIIFSIYDYQRHYSKLTEEVQDRNENLAVLASKIVHERLSSVSQQAETLATRPSLVALAAAKKWGEANPSLQSTLEPKVLERVMLVAPDGTVKAARPSLPPAEDFSRSSWFHKAFKEQQPYVSELQRRPQTSVAPYFIASAPVINPATGAVVAVVAVQIRAESLVDWTAENFEIGQGGMVYTVDSVGNLLAHPRYDASYDAINFSKVSIVDKIQGGVVGTDIVASSVGEEERLLSFAPIEPFDWGVVMTQPTAVVFAERDSSLRRQLAAGLVFLCIGAGLAFYVNRSKQRLGEASLHFQDELAKYSTLIDSIGEGIIAVDVKGVVEFANPTAIHLLSSSERTLMGKKLSDAVDLVKPNGKKVPEEAHPHMIALSTNRIANSDNYYYTRPDRTKFAAAISASPIVSNGKIIGAVETFRDISETKEIEKTKDELVSLASHQLRTPLSAINWYSEMLLTEDVGKLNADQRDFVGEIHAGNQRMIELVNSLLDVSRLDLGKFVIEPVPTDVTKMAGQIVKELEGDLKKKEQSVVQVYDKAIPKDIPLDKKWMWAVIHNFMTNAVKYTPPGGKIELAIKLAKQMELPVGYWAGKAEKSLLITVKDNGYGIPESQQNKIFQKLFRADNVREREEPGTGLGLYLVKSVVEQNGGKVWFESTENKGTTFFVNMPLEGMKPKTNDLPTAEEMRPGGVGMTEVKS